MNLKFDGIKFECGDSPEELYATLSRLYDNLNDAGRDAFWGGDSYVNMQTLSGDDMEWDFASVYIGLYWAQTKGAAISIPVAYKPGPLHSFERFNWGSEEDGWALDVYDWAINWRPGDTETPQE